MSHNEDVIDEMVSVIRRVGTGSGGTRNISGTNPYQQRLEKPLAELQKKEGALIFNSTYLIIDFGFILLSLLNLS